MLETYLEPQNGLTESFQQLPSGAVLLYENGFFPWGALPYPKAHADLGRALAQVQGYEEICLKMANFQMALLDHRQKPIYSFFQQETGCFFEELDLSCHQFFNELSLTPPAVSQFIDHDLGIFSRRDEEETIVLLASGCKTGMGSFLYKDLSILNFAPQLRPVGECSGFGLSAKGSQLSLNSQGQKCVMTYQNRLSAFSPRVTGIPWLSDSGFSSMWFTANLQTSKKFLSINCEMEGFRPLSDVAFSFFCKANHCLIAKSHKLNPRSLDRYSGPPQEIELKGRDSKIIIHPKSGLSQMEIIPLAGDKGFWGAEFLISFSLKNKDIEIEVNASDI